MRRLAAFVVRRRRAILIVSVLVLPFAAFLGVGVAERLSVGGMRDPGSESSRTADTIRDDFRSGPANFLVLVEPKHGTVDDPATVAIGDRLTARLERARGVADVVSYWSPQHPLPLRGRNGHSALITARLLGDEDDAVDTVRRLAPEYTIDNDVITSRVGGHGETYRQITQQADEDLHRSEALTAPLMFAALVVVFGSLVAALLPLVIAIIAVLGAFVALTIIGSITQVSVFSLNLVTGLGLGLGINYSLFIVSRYREELRAGGTTQTAIAHALLTAGRTVAFSAGTVAISLASLLVFPVAYLRSFAFAGVTTVALAAFAAIVVLPALLAVLGPRIDKGRVFKPKERTDEEGFWYRQTMRVMRRPWLYCIAIVVLLLALGAPFLRLQLGLADDRVVPPTVPARATNDVMRKEFDDRETSALGVLVRGSGAVPSDATVNDLAIRLSKIAGVGRVDASTGYYLKGARVLPADAVSKRFVGPAALDATWLSVVPSIEPISAQGEQLVHAIRTSSGPLAISVSGPSAELVDTKQVVTERLPYALAIIALTTLVLLFLMVGSVLVPIKALVLNLLSLSATFGAMVWIFQDGRFAGFLDYTPTGNLDIFTPILMFCIAFGTSMDYEVFLLSRIKEEHDLTGDNQRSVALGLQRTGRIVTAAALTLALVFVAFSTSKVQVVKLFGLGLTIAVLIDAFLIRATLVPAFMQLAGRGNWWAPRALRRWHLRWGIWETEPIAILDVRDGLVAAGAGAPGSADTTIPPEGAEPALD